MDSDKDFFNYYKEVLHEIKNPLDIIKAHAEYLIKNACKDKGETDEYLSIIIGETERLRRFLEEVSESIKVVKLNLNLNDVDRIINDVIKNTALELEQKDITLEYSSKNDMPKILVDENKIYRALINIINNAIHAVEPGGRIVITTDANELFYIRIKDNGNGIKTSDIKKIFDPFYTTKPEGSGLGLYITKKIVDAHGGSINVSSDLGDGAEFLLIFSIPKEERSI